MRDLSVLRAVREQVAAWLRVIADRLAAPEDGGDADSPPEHWRRLVAERAPQLLQRPAVDYSRPQASPTAPIPARSSRAGTAQTATQAPAAKPAMRRTSVPDTVTVRPRRVAPVAELSGPPATVTASDPVVGRRVTRLRGPSVGPTPELPMVPAPTPKTRSQPEPVPADRRTAALHDPAGVRASVPRPVVHDASVDADPAPTRRNFPTPTFAAATEPVAIDRWPSLPDSAPLPVPDRRRAQRLAALDTEQVG